MAIKNAQFDHNEVRFSGASDFWDTPAGQIVSAEYFPVAAPVGDLILATAAITEVGDAVAGTVLVTEAPRIATLAITEAANTASSLVGVRVTANFSGLAGDYVDAGYVDAGYVSPGPLEFPDSVEASVSAANSINIDVALTESPMTATGAATVAIKIAAGITQGADSASGSAAVPIIGAAVLTEMTDAASAATLVQIVADAGFYELADVIAGLGNVAVPWREVSLERTYLIAPQLRAILIAAECRKHTVEPQVRLLSVPAENRVAEIPAQPRAVVIPAQNRVHTP